jgi:hypothetical protein
VLLVAGVVMGLAVAAALALSPSEASDERTGKLVIAGLLFLACLFIGKDALKPADAHPTVVALADGAREVVWIYVRRVSRFGGGGKTWMRSMLDLGLTNGKIVSLQVPKKRDQEFVDLAASLAPHALVGYDRDRERKFVADPKSLRRG